MNYIKSHLLVSLPNTGRKFILEKELCICVMHQESLINYLRKQITMKILLFIYILLLGFSFGVLEKSAYCSLLTPDGSQKDPMK